VSGAAQPYLFVRTELLQDARIRAANRRRFTIVLLVHFIVRWRHHRKHLLFAPHQATAELGWPDAQRTRRFGASEGMKAIAKNRQLAHGEHSAVLLILARMFGLNLEQSGFHCRGTT
jgi:hypothetical protein